MDQVIGARREEKWSERSQRLLQDQYEQAMTDDKIVVFVRDNDEKKLVSYTV